jgi:gliding motility-associated-like protein
MSDIGNFFQENLAKKAIEPSEALWQKIVQNPELMRFNRIQRMKRIMAYSLGGVVVSIIVSTVLWLNWPAQDKATLSQNSILATDDLSQTASEPTIAPNLPTEPASSQVTDNQKEANNTTAISPPVTSTPAMQLSTHSVTTAPATSTMPAPNTAATPQKPANNSHSRFEPATSAKNDPSVLNKTTPSPTILNDTATSPSIKNVSLSPSEEELPTMEEYELFMPNAFSPNGDGINDRYELTAAFEINSFSLYIYDKAGQLVFKSTDITHTWNGEINGNTLPADIYLYLVKYTDTFNRIHQKKGNILLIR